MKLYKLQCNSTDTESIFNDLIKYGLIGEVTKNNKERVLDVELNDEEDGSIAYVICYPQTIKKLMSKFNYIKDYYIKESMVSLKNHLNESLTSVHESKKEKNIILQKYNEDRSMDSVASCYNWLDALGWQKMSKSEYAKEIYNINDDIEPEFGEEEYGDVMIAMQKLGKVQAYEYLKSIDKYDELEDYI